MNTTANGHATDAGELGALHAVNAEALRPGMVFDRALRAEDGRILLHAGVELTASMCEALSGLGAALYAEAGDADDEQARRRAAHRREWEERREARRAIAALRGEAADVVARRRPLWDRLDRRVVGAREDGRAGAGGGPGPERTVSKGAMVEDAGERARAGVVARMMARAVRGEVVSPLALVDLVEGMMDEAFRRTDEGVQLRRPSYEPGSLDELADHGLTSAGICVRAGLRLGWSTSDVRDAGLVGLMCDWGMALLPAEVRAAPRPMNDEESNQVRRHASWSVALVDRMMSAPGGRALGARVALGVYQHHEREDGSGYPEHTRGEGLHDLAKLAGAADVLGGLAAERAFRPAVPGAGAVARVARMAREGVLSAWAALAVVDACGVYPRGTNVRLSDGRAGIVVARGRARGVDRPVVEVREVGMASARVDLGEADGLSVAAVLDR